MDTPSPVLFYGARPYRLKTRSRYALSVVGFLIRPRPCAYALHMAKRNDDERIISRRTGQAERLVRLGLPADTDCRLPVITVSCGRYVKVEHHSGIILLSGNVIRLYTALGPLRIEGCGLIASGMDGEEMLIDGRVKSVAFEQFGRKQGKIE